MVDNQQKSEGEKRIEEWVLCQGYPDMETYRLEGELVKLGWALSDGDESVRDEYYAIVDKVFAKGWTPYLLDGQQEVMLGIPLSLELYDRDDINAQAVGYPNGAVRSMSNRLVALGRRLSYGDESIRVPYYELLDKVLARGWHPNMLNPHEEEMLGWELYAEMFEKYEAYVKQQA